MMLTEWLEKTRTTQQKLAKMAGVSQGHISKLTGGKVGRVSVAVALRIEKATKKKVTVKDLLSTSDKRG